MAERVIRLRDLAASLIAAGSADTPAGAGVAAVALEMVALTSQVPLGDRFWSMRLRQPGTSSLRGFVRWPWFARYRRASRRRAGWAPHRLTLRWTPAGLDAAIDGHPVAHIDLSDERTFHAHRETRG